MDVEGTLETLFDETCSSLVFVLDQIAISGTQVDVQVGLDVPDEVGEAIQQHDFVKVPVATFLDRARAALPTHTIKFSMFVDCLSDSSADAWKRLELALVKQGKSQAAYDELAKLRARK
jgi:hypothetical protein